MMPEFLDRLHAIGSSPEWLASTNIVLSALLLVWILRHRLSHREARREQRNNRELIENLSEGIYRSSLDGRQRSANRALVALNGYSSEEEMLAAVKDIGSEWYVDPARRQEFRDILWRDG